jgi:hypothetical protein
MLLFHLSQISTFQFQVSSRERLRFLEYAVTSFSSSETPIPLDKALVTVMDSMFGGYFASANPRHPSGACLSGVGLSCLIYDYTEKSPFLATDLK